MEWKQINEKYSINSNGQIWSHKTGKYLKLHTNPNGYVVYKNRYVHQIMMDLFDISKADDGQDYTVDHINRISTDNRLCNLRWLTRKEQQANRKEAKQRLPELELCEWMDLMITFLTGDYSHYQITEYMNIKYNRDSDRVVYLRIINGQCYRNWYEGYLTYQQHERIKQLNADRKTY